MRQTAWPGNMVPQIYRAGIRYDDYTHRLVPFGWFDQDFDGEVREWTQAFDTSTGLCTTHCLYEDGAVVDTEVFCHAEMNIVGIRKRISGRDGIAIRYHVGAPRMTVAPLPEIGLSFEIDTAGNPKGAIIPVTDGSGAVESDGLCVCRSAGSELACMLCFSAQDAVFARKSGFDAILESSGRAWSVFWGASNLHLQDEAVLQACRTAEYHLKISTTKWSIPVGLFQTHWKGLYFGFDEYFACCGLAATGHIKEAMHVPVFRRNTLEPSMKRAYSYFGKAGTFAKYPWVSMETPCVEGASPGFWLEHIFHMAHIALDAKFCFDISRDIVFLRDTAYPVIRACAEFFRIQAVSLRPDGTAIISKCTDLERLGPARENPFMTTCGAAATLRAAADSAKIIGIDTEMANQWRALASKLLESLPADKDKYIPYPGCCESSVAMLSGLYPYAVLPADDKRQLAAVHDFLARENEFGNMYPVGKGICIWYACWKALALMRLGCRDEAWSIIRDCAAETGCFHEIFEIYETSSHPWFTTAEGIFLQAVAECSALAE